MIELAADTGPSAADTAVSLGTGVSPHAVIKSIGVMVSAAATAGAQSGGLAGGCGALDKVGWLEAACRKHQILRPDSLHPEPSIDTLT